MDGTSTGNQGWDPDPDFFLSSGSDLGGDVNCRGVFGKGGAQDRSLGGGFGFEWLHVEDGKIFRR